MTIKDITKKLQKKIEEAESMDEITQAIYMFEAYVRALCNAKANGVELD